MHRGWWLVQRGWSPVGGGGKATLVYGAHPELYLRVSMPLDWAALSFVWGPEPSFLESGAGVGHCGRCDAQQRHPHSQPHRYPQPSCLAFLWVGGTLVVASDVPEQRVNQLQHNREDSRAQQGES